MSEEERLVERDGYEEIVLNCSSDDMTSNLDAFLSAREAEAMRFAHAVAPPMHSCCSNQACAFCASLQLVLAVELPEFGGTRL